MLVARSATSAAMRACGPAASASSRSAAALARKASSSSLGSVAPSQRCLSLLATATRFGKGPLALRSTMNFSTSLSTREKVQVPQMAESITEGTLKQWIKNKGDFVKEGEEIATIETDKIDVSVNAPISGTITETFSNEEDTVTVGKDLCNIEPGEAPAEGSSSGGGAETKEGSSSSGEKKDESKKEDKPQEKEQPKKEEPKPKQQPQQQEKSTAKKDDKKPSSSSSSASVESSSPAPGSRNERRVKMSRMRVRIAERLKQSQNTAASLTTFNEIDMSSLIAFRARHKDTILKNEGVKLGFMSAFAKASAMALKEIPAANGTIEGEGLGDTIVYRDYVDLSVAVSTEKGLVTPVVRNIETMSLIQIEREIAALGKKARDNKLTIEDMSGGTFTISNGGVFGSLFGTPILNLPGSAILGMHAVKDKAWVVDGKVEVRPIMVVALTYDHRLLDGREAVTFLVRLKQYIEDMPSMLL